jgi:hypothetical protein
MKYGLDVTCDYDGGVRPPPISVSTLLAKSSLSVTWYQPYYSKYPRAPDAGLRFFRWMRELISNGSERAAVRARKLSDCYGLIVMWP